MTNQTSPVVHSGLVEQSRLIELYDDALLAEDKATGSLVPGFARRAALRAMASLASEYAALSTLPVIERETVSEAATERQILELSAYLWNAIGNKTNGVANKFGINGWYALVKEAVAATLTPPRTAGGITPREAAARARQYGTCETCGSARGHDYAMGGAFCLNPRCGLNSTAGEADVLADEVERLLTGNDRNTYAIIEFVERNKPVILAALRKIPLTKGTDHVVD